MKMKQLNDWLSLLTNIGVLAGIFLLVIELNQNTNLMRAEMHAMRAEAKATRQMEFANSGEISRIMSTVFADGFPRNPDALDALTPEDQFRARSFLLGLSEAVDNWHYQCQQDLLEEELCKSGYEAQARLLIVMSRAAGIDFSSNRASFIADLRRIAAENDLPAPQEDGTW